MRVQFAKVAEYQRRGVIHFHALIRLDGPPTDTDPYPAPAVEVDSATLADLVRTAAGHVVLRRAGDRRATISRGGCGSAPSSTPARSPAPPTGTPTGRSCTPKRSPPTSPNTPPKPPPTSPPTTDGGNRHLRRLQATLRQLAGRAAIAALAGGEEPYRGWGRWVDMLGFRGHLATKSRRYSITLGRLRQARRDYARRTRTPHDELRPAGPTKTRTSTRPRS